MAPIRHVEYTKEENDLWNYIYNKVRPFHKNTFSKKYEKQF